MLRELVASALRRAADLVEGEAKPRFGLNEDDELDIGVPVDSVGPVLSAEAEALLAAERPTLIPPPPKEPPLAGSVEARLASLRRW